MILVLRNLLATHISQLTTFSLSVLIRAIRGFRGFNCRRQFLTEIRSLTHFGPGIKVFLQFFQFEVGPFYGGGT